MRLLIPTNIGTAHGSRKGARRTEEPPLGDAHLRIRDEARDFVKTIPRQLVLDMDQDKVDFPRELLRAAGRPPELGGRGLDWVASAAVMEEIGALGYILPHRAARRLGLLRHDHFRLHGQKRFIVGGTAADYFLVYARTDQTFAIRATSRGLTRMWWAAVGDP